MVPPPAPYGVSSSFLFHFFCSRSRPRTVGFLLPFDFVFSFRFLSLFCLANRFRRSMFPFFSFFFLWRFACFPPPLSLSPPCLKTRHAGEKEISSFYTEGEEVRVMLRDATTQHQGLSFSQINDCLAALGMGPFKSQHMATHTPTSQLARCVWVEEQVDWC
ncbi:hypothetical protein GGS20DRAFT_544789, partial [Poronia punctata]